MPHSALLIACFALALLLLAVPRLRERGFEGRSWMLLRALFPSWRFFEELGHVPQLSFRMLPGGDWRECLGREPRHWYSVFVNPRGNLRMAQNSLIEQLMTDLAELPDEGALSFEKSVSYELATRLVHFRIRELGLAHAGARFQFRIRAAVPGSAEFGGTDEDDALTSSEHTL